MVHGIAFASELVAVAVFLVGIMAYAGANGRLTAAPQELLGVVLMPLQKVTSALSGGIGSVWEKYTSIDDVMDRNEQLEAENAELRQQMVDYDRIKAEAAEIVDKELDRLRKDPVLCKLLPPEQGS